MSSHEVPDVPVWSAVLDELAGDDRVTPQLQGFLSLAVPQGVMGGTLYLDVPNDLTAAQINTYVQSVWGAGCATFLTTPSSANLQEPGSPQ